MKAKELLSPNFDPFQPIPSTLNLGWSAIEKHFLNHHNRYLYPGQEKGGEVTPCFEDEGITAIFSSIQVHLNDDDLQPERDLYYNPESYLQFLTKFLNKQLEPACRCVQSIKWHFTDGMPFICLRLTSKPVQPMEMVCIQEPVYVPKSRVMEESETVFGKSGRAQAQTEAV